MNRAPRGFTLIELVVVVSILVLLAGVLVPVVSKEMDKTLVGRATTDMKTLAEAYNRYFIHTGYWPTESKSDAFAVNENFALTSMECLYSNLHDRKNWNGPYLSAGALVSGARSIAASEADGWTGFVDPWGNPYRMFYFAKNEELGPFGGLAIASYGKNATRDTSDAEIASGNARVDDVLMIITRSL